MEEAIGEWSARLEGLGLSDRMSDSLLRINMLDGILFPSEKEPDGASS